MVKNVTPTIMAYAAHGYLYNSDANPMPNPQGFGEKMKMMPELKLLGVDFETGRYGVPAAVVESCRYGVIMDASEKIIGVNPDLKRLVMGLDSGDISQQNVVDSIAAGSQTASHVCADISRKQDVYLDMSTGKLHSGLEFKPSMLNGQANMDFMFNFSLDRAVRVMRYDPESGMHIIDQQGAQTALDKLNHLKGQDPALLACTGISNVGASHKFMMDLLSGDAEKNAGRLNNVIDFTLASAGKGRGSGYDVEKANGVLASPPLVNPISLLVKSNQFQNA